jgi:hypothetical protein
MKKGTPDQVRPRFQEGTDLSLSRRCHFPWPFGAGSSAAFASHTVTLSISSSRTQRAVGQYRNPVWTNRVGIIEWRELSAEVANDVAIARRNVQK